MPPADRVVPVPGHGAEDVVVDAEGWVFTGTEDGAVFAVDGRAARASDRVGNTGGRPLGLELLPDGRLLVCDAQRGPARPRPGHRRARDARHGSARPADAWSATTPRCRRRHDLLLRLLRRAPDRALAGRPGRGHRHRTAAAPRPRRQHRRARSTGLRFANGVALAADESCVVVAETTGRTVVRLADRRAGGAAGPPGRGPARLPRQHRPRHRRADLGHDRLAAGPDARAAAPAAAARVRRAATRSRERLQPQPGRRCGCWPSTTTAGSCTTASATPAYHMVTGVREHQGRVWLGSLEEPAVAFFDL